MAKQNLSRQAKKHLDETSQPAKKADLRKVATPPKQAVAPPKPAAAPPKPAVAPPKPVVPEPVVVAVSPPPPEKTKRPRFVREKVEKKPEAKTKALPLPPRSKKLVAKLMSQNLAIPPKDDRTGLPKP